MFLDPVDYGKIFDERGASYHAAMDALPQARKHEFRRPLELLNIAPGQVLIDLPAGGGYLRHFLPEDIRYICVESSQVFFNFCRHKGLHSVLMDKDAVALDSEVADNLVSIAGVHHVENKCRLFAEMRRLLKPSGKVCIADVAAGSAVASFLDEFVDKFTSTGHAGKYLSNAETTGELKEAGFKNVEHTMLNYHWQFSNTEQLIWYCKKIFALEATDADVLDGLETYLGIEKNKDAVLLPWQLMGFVATAY
ncbi:class I SAM-dependent methyltransferase [Alteromonas halophila]|uniref:Methyltransferase type 11 domain-containing protein n=1 Tax=Alteromonas halophila TaxID=516698 RepID=A0A918JDL9_9ALTE|nr:methyltransferase domain-containing protein [Alteromonas halophila]GGW75734.1 hypothetical protein GCM10007391_05110 [Alteromonas halophila]